MRREAVEGADVAYCLEFGVEVLRGITEVVGSSGQGSDGTVLGGVRGAGRVLHVEVGVSRLAVHGCGLFGVYQDVQVGEVASGGNMLNGVLQVTVEGVDVGEEGVGVLSVGEGSDPILNEVSVGARRVRSEERWRWRVVLSQLLVSRQVPTPSF